ncbi:hypothetical protein [Marinilabilia rubra]|uniref:hypothetical protein n=1 Tax=Marinilabilia rubra TaxID=2162893 RepID=UPI0011B2277E|nr:hypothetical protein [Marinilabilia rubra]
MVEYPYKGKLKIPDLGEREFVKLAFVYEDSTIVTIEVSIKDHLVCSGKVSWVLGIDSVPFDKRYLKGFPVWKTTTKVFFWNNVSDGIEDLLVIPLNGSPEINFPIFEEDF